MTTAKHDMPIKSDAKRLILALERYMKSLKEMEFKYYPLDNSTLIKRKQDYINEIKKYHKL
jgi:hypothetical protein